MALAHLVNDTYAWMLPALLPLLLIKLDISLGLAGVLITLNQTSGTAFAGTISGVTRTLIAGEITALQSQLMYANVHSQLFSGGEIRGQIVPVPEPGTLALVGLGGLGLFAAVRRKI